MGDGAPHNKQRKVRRSAAPARCANDEARRGRVHTRRKAAIRSLSGHHLAARVADDGDSRNAVRIASGTRAAHARPDSRTIVTQSKKP
ncbi:hypothetical protein A6456_32710 [Paraburkholderia tropica]|nr:hypothetical protein A6456_32710 [Paraburkholderia tropica]